MARRGRLPIMQMIAYPASQVVMDTRDFTLAEAGIQHILMLHAAMSERGGVLNKPNTLRIIVGPRANAHMKAIPKVVEACWTTGEDGFARYPALFVRLLQTRFDHDLKQLKEGSTLVQKHLGRSPAVIVYDLAQRLMVEGVEDIHQIDWTAVYRRVRDGGAP